MRGANTRGGNGGGGGERERARERERERERESDRGRGRGREGGNPVVSHFSGVRCANKSINSPRFSLLLPEKCERDKTWHKIENV